MQNAAPPENTEVDAAALASENEELKRENADLKANNKPLSSVQLAEELRQLRLTNDTATNAPELDYSLMDQEEYRKVLKAESDTAIQSAVADMRKEFQDELGRVTKETETKRMVQSEFSRQIDSELLKTFPEAASSVPIIKDIEKRDSAMAYSLGPERLYALIIFEQLKAKRLTAQAAGPVIGGEKPPVETPGAADTADVKESDMSTIIASSVANADKKFGLER